MAIDRKKIEDYLRNAKFPMDWAEFAEVMRLAGVSAAGTSKAFNDFNRAAKLQQDRENDWQQRGYGKSGNFRRRPPTSDFYQDYNEFFNQYARGTWSNHTETEGAYAHNKTYNREGKFDYTYTVPDDNMSDEFYEKFTGHKRDYADYVAIPGLPGWSAPSGYNKYSTGPMAGSHTIITKDMKVNNHSAAFETIPFQFIPPELF